MLLPSETSSMQLPVMLLQPCFQSKKTYYHASRALAQKLTESSTTRQDLKRGWIFALIGLFVAVVAGLVGGYID